VPGSDTLSLNLLMSCENLQLAPDYCYNTITVHEVMVISDGHPAFTKELKTDVTPATKSQVEQGVSHVAS